MLENLLKIHSNNIAGGSTVRPLNPAFGNIDVAQNENSVTNAEFSNKPFVYFNFLKIKDPQEKQMYNVLYNSLDTEGKTNFEALLTTGRLLSKNSADGSSTLRNLYKIATEPRVAGVDSKKVIDETIKTLVNPFIINQNFGKIPDFMTAGILANEQQNNLVKGVGLNNTLAPHFNQAQVTGPFAVSNPEDLNVETSGTCVAASIEFNLADKKPAEFARYVAGLTSPDLSVATKVKLSNIDSNREKAIAALNDFGVKYNLLDQDNAEVVLQPDRNAIIRARVQNTYQKPGTRSTIDTLIQSTVMQLGSSNGYNSLIDKRAGEYVPDNKGLVEFEKNFAESVIDDTGKKTSVTYQIVEATNENDNYLKGYNFDFETTKKHIFDTLKSGSNVIVGIVQTDGNNKIIGGHEITITGSKMDKDGELYFKYNDTDDDYTGSVEISAKALIPKIHHAGIPAIVLNNFEQQKV